LADDLLVIARSDQGDLPIRRERVNVHELLQRVQRRFSIPAGDREISVHNPPGLEANVDPLRVEQAVGNLVDNAIRHGAGPVSLSARTQDGLLVLDVADGGPGFPQGFGPSAFNRFTRADEGRTTGGAGLGLAIVLAIARAHGGTARVVDAEPPGMTVQISLPRRA
jgi:two-component system OmpR family sensor kinase